MKTLKAKDPDKNASGSRTDDYAYVKDSDDATSQNEDVQDSRPNKIKDPDADSEKKRWRMTCKMADNLQDGE